MTPRLTSAATQAAACRLLAAAAVSAAELVRVDVADEPALASVAGRVGEDSDTVLEWPLRANASPAATAPARMMASVATATRRSLRGCGGPVHCDGLPGCEGLGARAGKMWRCIHSRSVVAITVGQDGSGSGRPSLLNEATPRPRLRRDAALTAPVHHITTPSDNEIGICNRSPNVCENRLLPRAAAAYTQHH